MPVKIFFCYAHEDEALLNQLKKQMSPLQRQGLIDVWYDRDISAGTEWEQEISKQLNTAQIILLLVSPDFIDSDYCYGIEMKRALERHERGEAQVIPVILRPTLWQETPLGKLKALPEDGKAVSGWRHRDEAFWNVAKGISQLVVMPTSHTQADEKNQSAKPEPNISVDVIREVLSICYRRAIFTPCQLQLNFPAMFKSLSECLSKLQPIVVNVSPEGMQQIVAGIIGELDFIQRCEHNTKLHGQEMFFIIDRAKLRIIQALQELSRTAQIPFVPPPHLIGEFYISEKAADKPPRGFLKDPLYIDEAIKYEDVLRKSLYLSDTATSE